MLVKYAAIALAFVAVWFYAVNHGESIERLKWQTSVREATDEARLDEQKKQGVVNALSQKQYDALAGVNAALLRDLNGLRDRPPRASVPDDTPARCEGATGRDLSRPDAQFLTRLAARADTQRAALSACYEYADTVAPGS